MSGTEVTLGLRRLIYLTPEDDISESQQEALFRFDRFEDRDLRAHPRLRRALTTIGDSPPLIYTLLHWSDGTDLNALDRRVTSGRVDDSDFISALLVEPSSVNCAHCHASLRVLRLDGGNFILEDIYPQVLQEHKYVPECPVCGNALGLRVVEVI